MRVTRFLSLLFVASVGCASSEKPHARESQGARVSVDSEEHIGEPDSTGHVVHEFAIKNVGNVTLALSEINSTCGCTVARVSTQEIKPGEQATVHVDFHATPDRRESAVYVHTNDVNRRVIRFRIAATKLQDGIRQLQFLPAVVHVRTEVGRSANGHLLLQLTEWGALPAVADSLSNADLTSEISGIRMEFDSNPVNLLEGIVTWKERAASSAANPTIRVVHPDRVVTIGQVSYSIDASAFIAPGEHRRVLLAQVGTEKAAVQAVATLIVHVVSTTQ